MKRITLEIPDEKVAYFMELIKQLGIDVARLRILKQRGYDTLARGSKEDSR